MSIQMKATAYSGPDTLQPFEVNVPRPGPGEVTIRVRAAGVNPTDWKGIAGGGYGVEDAAALPKSVGTEVAGVIEAVARDARVAGNEATPGLSVIAFPVQGGYAEQLTVSADAVFLKPANLDSPEAANLLLVGTTAADMLRVVAPTPGETVIVHGASSAVGVSLLQQIRALDCRVLGTASDQNFGLLRQFGAEPLPYGDGLEERTRDAATEGVTAAFDCVGTDEAIDVSLALVANRSRAEQEGIAFIDGASPQSRAFRLGIAQDLVDSAARGELTVPMARTFPLREAADALRYLQRGHPGGKIALIR